MTTVFRTTTVAGLLAASVSTVAFAEIGDVGDLCPSNSVFVMRMDSPRTMIEELNGSSFGRLLDMEELRGPMQQMMTEMRGGLEMVFDETDMDLMTLAAPGGMAMSIFATTDDETGATLPGLVIAADYGDEADRMVTRLMSVFRMSEEEGDIRLESADMSGREITVLDFSGEPDLDDLDDPGMGGMGMGMGFDPEAMLESAFGTMYLAQEGGHVLITSDEGAVRRMFDLADGDRVSTLTDRPDVAQIGEVLGDSDVAMAFLLRDLPEMIGIVDQMGMTAMMTPILQQFTGRITAIAAGSSLDAESETSRSRIFVSMPDGKAGLTKLIDVSGTTADVPAFVPADVDAYSQMSFNFAGVGPLIRQMMGTAAMFGAPLGDPDSIAQMEEQINQFTDLLGQQVHQVGLGKLGDSDMPSSVTAIASTDVRTLDAMIGQYGAMMGMEGADFLGHRVYRLDLGGMMGGMPGGGGMMPGMGMPEAMAIGIGGGHMFIGDQTGVETCLRRIGDEGGESLADDPRIKRGIADLAGAGSLIGWGWSDTAETLAGQMDGMKSQMSGMMEMMPPGEMDGMGEMAMIMGIMEVFDAETLRSIFGDSSWVARSTDDGFVVDMIQYAPKGAAPGDV